VTVRVLVFARLRELLGFGERDLTVAESARVGDVWTALADQVPQIEELRATVRAARDGSIVKFDEPLGRARELAFLPPVGGG
jgi:sulfur-carrier protein